MGHFQLYQGAKYERSMPQSKSLTFRIRLRPPDVWGLIAQAPAAQRPAADPQAKSEAVAEVSDVPITNEQVEKALGMNLSKLQEQIYMKRQALDALVPERVLANEAARRTITVTGAHRRRNHLESWIGYRRLIAQSNRPAFRRSAQK